MVVLHHYEQCCKSISRSVRVLSILPTPKYKHRKIHYHSSKVCPMEYCADTISDAILVVIYSIFVLLE